MPFEKIVEGFLKVKTAKEKRQKETTKKQKEVKK
jgi:hypothetical protein